MPTPVGSDAQVGTGTSVIEATIPTVEDGDEGWLLVHAANSAATTLNVGSTGWSIEYGPFTNGTNTIQTWVLKKTLAATDSGTTTTGLTLSSSSTHSVALAAVHEGVLSVQAQRQDASLVTTFMTPGFTTVADGELAICFGGITFQNSQTPATAAVTAPTGWTKQSEAATASGTVRVGAVVLTRDVATAGSQGTSSGGGLSVNHRDNIVVLSFAPADVEPPEPTPVDPTALGQVGDSLSAQGVGPGPSDMISRYETAGYTEARVDGIVGRYVYNNSDAGGGTSGVIEAWEADGFNPYTLVLALGTNDVLSHSATLWATALLDIRGEIAVRLPGEHRIVWVDVVADPTGGQGMDGVIGTSGNAVADWNTFLAANLADGEEIADWYGYASTETNLSNPANSPTRWQNDASHVHMSTAGYTARNTWLAANITLDDEDGGQVKLGSTLVDNLRVGSATVDRLYVGATQL